MSSQQQKKGSSNQFCKVCFDSGKSFTKYSSHNVRNSGGDVICPTLLNQICKYCKKQGHTPSHCPDLKGKYNNKQKQAVQKQAVQAVQKQAVQKQAEQVQSKQAEQVQSKQAVQKQAVQVQALQKRAARLCESPPPPPCLNSFGNKMDSTEEKKIVRPIAIKQNCWAKNSSAKNSWANVVMRSCNERAPSPETEEEQEQASEEQEQEQASEEQAEQDQAEQDQAEQDQAEQDQAEQDQAEQDQASESEEQEEQAPESEEEQEQTSVVVAEQEQKPTVNKYVPTSYSSWADAD